ncbi:LPXTG cell wall anchor domain-containing protein, partial [Facklamia languida]
PDDSTDTVPAEDLVKEKEKEDKTIADEIDPTIPEKTEVEDKDNLTDDEKKEVKDKIEETNKDKFPEGTEVEVDDKGNATITYPDDSTDTVPAEDLVKEKEKEDKTIADEIDPTIPEKTEVEDKDNLTDDEKKEVKDKIEETNKDKFPEGTEVEVDDKGNATITYPDDSTDTVPAEDLVKEKEKEDKTIADEIDPTIPEKTEVEDKDNLTDDEKKEVKDKIEETNKDKFPEGTEVEVDDKGNATITYPDDSTDTIPAEDLVKEKEDKTIADEIDPTIPEKTEVGDVNDLTESEREHVKEAIEEANKDNFPEGTDVTVNEDGSATITYPDGSKDSIAADQLIFQREDDSDAEDDDQPSLADQTDITLPEKTGVKDINNLTEIEKEKVKIAITDANKLPKGTEVLVGSKGDVIINYPDGSHDVIDGKDLVYQLADSETGKPADPDKGGAPSKPGTGEADKGSDDASDSKGDDKDSSKDKDSKGDDKDSSKDKDSKGSDQGSSKDSKAKDSQDKLPQTGESSSAAILGLAGLSIMAGLGLVAGRRKEDN